MYWVRRGLRKMRLFYTIKVSSQVLWMTKGLSVRLLVEMAELVVEENIDTTDNV